MRRFFILLCCIILLVSLSCSAFAVSYGWEDFAVSHGTYPDGTSWANCEFPSSMGRFNFYNGNTFIEAESGGDVFYSWSAGQVPRFRYLPLGQQGTSAAGVGKLALKPRDNTYGIANGTELRLRLDLTNDANTFANFQVIFSVSYYNSNETFVSEDILEQTVSGYFPLNFDIYYVVNAPADAEYVAFYVDIRSNVTLSSSLNNVGIHASKFTMFGEGLVWHDWKVTLDGINDALNGDYDANLPEQPDFQPILDWNPIIAGILDDFNLFVDSFEEYFNDFTAGLSFLTLILEEIFEIRFIRSCLYLVLIMGVAAFALNLLVNVPSKVSDGSANYKYTPPPKPKQVYNYHTNVLIIPDRGGKNG